MLFCFHCAQDPSSRSPSHLSSPLLVRHHPLILFSSFLSVLSGIQGRREGPTFNTISFSDITPCNPVTFSWTGGLSPFSLVIYNDDNGNTVQEFDGIESNSFSWTPPQRAVGKLLYAVVYDDDEFDDDTDDFVVQSASCSTTSSFAPPTIPTISVPSTTTGASARNPDTPPPTEGPTSQSSVPPSSPSTTSVATTTPRGSSSSPSQSLPRISTTSQPSNSTTSALPTIGTTSATDGSTSSPTSSPTSSSTTPAGQSTSSSRSHRKSSVPAGEIAGIVLGAVAILVMLVALVTWWWVVRRRTRDRARTTPEDDNYTALQSSKSTQHEPSLSSGKAAIRRHAYSTVSPTTTAPLSLLHEEVSELEAGGLGGGGGEDVLHVHGRPAANSLAVEPPTPQPFDDFNLNFDQRPVQVLRPISVLPPPQPLRTNGAEMKAPEGPGWGGRTTAVVADSPAELSPTTAGSETRGLRGLGLQAQDHLRPRLVTESPRDVDPDTKLGEDGDVGAQGAVLGARTRLTIIESDAGVRLAGGPPGLTPLDTDCTMITTLPPPYRHYDSSSVS